MEPMNVNQIIDILKKPAAHSLDLVSRALELILLHVENRELVPIPIISGGHHEYHAR